MSRRHRQDRQRADYSSLYNNNVSVSIPCLHANCSGKVYDLLTYERLVSYSSGPNAEVLRALELLPQLAKEEQGVVARNKVTLIAVPAALPVAAGQCPFGKLSTAAVLSRPLLGPSGMRIS
jgi:hypothetical protein